MERSHMDPAPPHHPKAVLFPSCNLFMAYSDCIVSNCRVINKLAGKYVKGIDCGIN
jgi:hypothetical protein